MAGAISALNEDKQWLRLRDLERLLGVSRTTLYRMRLAGLRMADVGGRKYATPETVREIMVPLMAMPRRRRKLPRERPASDNAHYVKPCSCNVRLSGSETAHNMGLSGVGNGLDGGQVPWWY